MSAPYKAEDIANAFIDKAIDSGCDDLSTMKLLKLVYIAHGWYLGYNGKPLISNTVQAWQYGPVIPDLYHKIKEYGDSNITEKLFKIELSGTVGSDFELSSVEAGIDPSDSDAAELINAVWISYGEMTGIQLSNLTHQKGSPWDQVYRKDMPSRDITIPVELIQHYYKSKIAEGSNG